MKEPNKPIEHKQLDNLAIYDRTDRTTVCQSLSVWSVYGQTVWLVLCFLSRRLWTPEALAIAYTQ